MYVAIDLFAGVGGISLGLEMAGILPILGVENDESCVEALKHNFPEKIIINEDIRKVKSEDIRKLIKNKDIDLLAGGPPCQGFSLIGLRDPNDERSRLVFEFLRIAKELKPKFLLIENVPGMLSAQKGDFMKELIKIINEIGYNVRTPIKILNSANFGVPQNRKRVFILAGRKDLNCIPNYPLPTHKNIREKKEHDWDLPFSPTVDEAIGDLIDIDSYDHLIESDKTEYTQKPKSDFAKIMRNMVKSSPFSNLYKNDWNPKICTGCRRTVHGEILKKRFAETKQGDVVPISRLYKLKSNDVANTLRAGTPRERGAYSAPRPVHPTYHRVISVREGARIQSFPDWHRFHKTKWHGFRQVGNAVPPLLAFAIAKEIKKSLDSLK